MEAWLPDDPVDSSLTALDGPCCWRPIFASPLFAKLVAAILKSPAEVVLLQLSRSRSSELLARSDVLPVVYQFVLLVLFG